MKVYIAGPMTGVVDYNYPLFNSTARILYQLGHDPLNPVDSEKENTETEYQQQSWDWYLRRAIRLLTEADAICLLPNWQNSKGANLEVHIAKSLSIQLMTLDINDKLVALGESQ